jgi:phage gp45-like
MWRSTVRDAAHRAYLAVTRGTLKKTADDKFWQYADINLFSGETIKNVERIQQYGITTRPLPEKDDKDKHPAEVIVAFLGGNRAHPMIFGIDDRRHRLKNLQEGEMAIYDDQGQRIHIKRSTISIETPMTITHRIVMPQQDGQQGQGQSGQSGQSGGQSGSQSQGQGQQAGTKQDAQQTRKDRTRITQGADYIHFEVMDGSGATKTSIRMDQNGITSNGDNLVDKANKDITHQSDGSMETKVADTWSASASTAKLSASDASGWFD